MSEQLRMEREDWISRFFGFLGSFQYMRQKRPVGYPFSLYGKSFSEIIEKEDREAGKIVDNIVYIYGVPESGKSTYRTMLADELPTDLYECMTFDFHKYNGILSNDDFCNLFAEFWIANKKLNFEFPCTKLSYGEERVGKSVYVDVLLDTAAAIHGIKNGEWPDKMNGIRHFINGGKKIFEWGENALTKTEASLYSELKNEMREAARAGKSIDISPSKDDPYGYLKMDLNANIKRYVAKKTSKKLVVFVDTFEEYAKVTGSDATLLMDYHPFVEFMASVPDVIWVVFGPKRPSEAIRKFVPSENCWCMKGARKESVLNYLSTTCNNASDEWKQAVYKRTAGYVPLLRYCVKYFEKFPPENESELYKLLASLAEERNLSQDILLQVKRQSGDSPKDLDLWFDCLWEANWSAWKGSKYIPAEEMSEEEKSIYLMPDVLSKMYRTEYSHAVNDSMQELGFFLPTLAYLVSKSSENVGTLQQFSWKRKAKFAELNSLGQGYVNSISSTTPFCLEFVEYPEHLYLDPVFIAIMQQNAHYEEWYALFCENCCLKDGDRTDNEGSLEASERAKDSVQDMGTTKHKTNKISTDIIEDEHTHVDDIQYESIDVVEKTDKPVEEIEDTETQGEADGLTPDQAAQASKHVNEKDKIDETGIDQSKSQGKGTTPERNPYVYTLADDVWKQAVWGDKVLPNNPPEK